MAYQSIYRKAPHATVANALRFVHQELISREIEVASAITPQNMSHNNAPGSTILLPQK